MKDELEAQKNKPETRLTMYATFPCNVLHVIDDRHILQ